MIFFVERLQLPGHLFHILLIPLVICSHSLGGVISSIVTTEILIEREKRPKEQFPGEVINITFGSPLFGDDTARRFLEEKNFSAKMFHFVAELDPVPSLLSFVQSISAVKKPGCLRLKISIIPYQDIN